MKRLLLALSCVLAFSSSTLFADTVQFKNGDRLSGKIETVVGGKLTLKTDSAGTVVIDMTKVDTFSTDAPIKLQLADGTVLNQKVNAAQAGKVELAGNEVIKAQPVALSALVAVNPPDKPKVVWKGNVTAGYTRTTGNSDTTSASLDLNFSRRSEEDRITALAYYLYGTEKTSAGEQTSKDKWGILLKYDYFISKRFYAFVNGSYEKDRIANLQARAIGAGGVGYQWVESPKMNFNTDAGLGFMHEQYSNPTKDNNTVVGQLGYHFDRKLLESLTFLHDLRFFPDLGGPSDFLVNTSAELRAALTRAIYASAKVVVDYNSQPAAGRKKTDVIYVLGVGVNF